MAENKLHDDFMKLGDMSDLDNQILADAGGDSLIDKVQEQKEKGISLRMPWMGDVQTHWFSYALLGLSFLLTEMLAVYLGLAPKMETALDGSSSIYWHTDFAHLATALVYMLVFPIVTEVAFDQARKKLHKAETGNFAQKTSMTVAVIVAVISIIGTGGAGGYLVLSTLGSAGIIEVPTSVQKWLIWAIPSLLATFAVLHMIYNNSSKKAKQQKIVLEEAEQDELEDQLRMKKIERAGNRAIRAAAIRSYERAVAEGLLSMDEAKDGLARGKSLAQLEQELKRDLTGDGLIGPAAGPTRPPRPILDEEMYHNRRPVNLAKNPRVSEADIDLAKSINPLSAPYRSCPGCGDIVPLTRSHCAVCGTDMPALPKPVTRVNGQNFE